MTRIKSFPGIKVMSEPEGELLFQIRATLGEDGYAVQHRFHPVRQWRFDFSFPDVKLAVEIEGGLYAKPKDSAGDSGRGDHTRGARIEADMEKYAEAMAMGWVVLRVSPRQVKSGQAIAWIERIIEARK